VIAGATVESTFLPAALEVARTPPSPAGRWLLWVIITVFVAAGAWASFGQVDIVAIAQGRVIPSGHSKTIQPLELGTVAAIHVTNGQSVRRGELLVELDTRAARAEVDRLRQSVEAATEDLQRYRILARWAAQVADELSPEPSGEDSLLQDIWSAHQARLAVLREARRRHRAEHLTAAQELKKLEAVMPLVTRRAEDQKALADAKLLAEQQYLDAEQQRIEATHDLLTQRHRVDELLVRIEEISVQIRSSELEFRRDAVQRVEDAARRVEEADQELIKSQARLSALTITAPVDGRVEQLAVHHPGAVVTPAQALMVVVPVDEVLEVEAVLENKDIGFVGVGQQVEIKLDAFPFTRYGTIGGEVVGLSSDSISDEQRGLVYTMRVRLDRSSIPVNGKPIGLTPGMTATVESITGKRRLIEYLMSPLLRYRDESARER
jgi:hemolysin D